MRTDGRTASAAAAIERPRRGQQQRVSSSCVAGSAGRKKGHRSRGYIAVVCVCVRARRLFTPPAVSLYYTRPTADAVVIGPQKQKWRQGGREMCFSVSAAAAATAGKRNSGKGGVSGAWDILEMGISCCCFVPSSFGRKQHHRHPPRRLELGAEGGGGCESGGGGRGRGRDGGGGAEIRRGKQLPVL